LTLILPSTSDVLRIVTSAAVSVDVAADWVDYTTATSATTPGATLTNIATAATTTVVAAPASGVVRNIKAVTIRNKDASLSVDVTVQRYNGTTAYEVIKVTLSAGDTLEFTEGSAWWKIANPVNAPLPNVSTADQAIGASVTNYITNSDLHVSAGRPLKVGTVLRWHVCFTKTAAATASMTFDLRVGTAGTTGDTSRASLATGTQSAVADAAELEVACTIRSISASGTITTSMQLEHNLAATGFAPTNVVVANTTSAAFDTTATNLIFGLSLTTGASHAITVTRAVAEFLGGTI
jgi:hypothetical protein